MEFIVTICAITVIMLAMSLFVSYKADREQKGQLAAT
jgi:hypothetical protein